MDSIWKLEIFNWKILEKAKLRPEKRFEANALYFFQNQNFTKLPWKDPII